MRYRRYLLINPRTVFIAGALISTAWSTSGAQSTSLARRGTVAGSASTMVASAQLLAIAEGPTVRMIDVSRPGSAVVVGEYTFADEVLALAVDGSTVYVANSHEGLHRLDVSNPAAPVAQVSRRVFVGQPDQRRRFAPGHERIDHGTDDQRLLMAVLVVGKGWRPRICITEFD